MVIGRNEDCDGVPGDEDVWAVRRRTLLLSTDNNPSNIAVHFGTKGTVAMERPTQRDIGVRLPR